MTVGGSVRVEALLTVDHAHALHGALLLEEEQVAVNGPQTQIWVSDF